MLRGITITVTLLSFCFAKISPEFWTQNQAKMLNDYEMTVTRVGSINQILNHPKLKDLDIENVLGKGSYGVVFAAKKTQELSVKVQLEDDGRYSSCTEAFDAYKKIINLGFSKYIVQMEEPIKFPLPASTAKRINSQGIAVDMDLPQRYVCLLKMEKGTAATELFFENIDVISNTKKMVRYMARLLEAFKILNFDVKHYHADVKPDNLLFVIREDGEYIPKLIDFDLMFQRSKLTDHPHNLVYTLGYRPPELTSIVPGWNFDDNKLVGRIQEQRYDAYVFNLDFKEEAFALGTTIWEILEKNQNYLHQGDYDLNRIKQIANAMVKQDPLERISTKQAYESAASYLKSDFILI